MCSQAPDTVDALTRKACNYLQDHDTDPGLSAWAMSQAIATTLSVGSNTSSQDYTNAFIAILDMYSRNCAARPCPYYDGLDPSTNSAQSATTFYDDNAMLGLDLVQAYRQMGGGQTQAQYDAEDILPFEQTGEWDANGAGIRNDDATCKDSTGHQCYPGGEWFSTRYWLGSADPTDPSYKDGNRTMQSTGGAGFLAEELYPITSDAYTRTWGEQDMLDWITNTLAGHSGAPNVFSPMADNEGNFGTFVKDDYGDSLYMAEDLDLYNLCHTGTHTERYASGRCPSYLKDGQTLLKGVLDAESENPTMEHACPAWNAMFFYYAKRLVNAIQAAGLGDGTTPGQFSSTWQAYNSYLRSNINTTNGEWDGGTTGFTACEAPLPIAGAVRSLIAYATGQ